MSIAELTAVPDLGYTYEDVQPGTAFRYGGDGAEQRISWQPLSRRRYSWPMHRGETERQSIDSFFKARNGTTSSFFILDPKDRVVTGVTLGTSVSGQTNFTLPAYPAEHSRYYVSSLTLKDDGAAVTATYTSYTSARAVGISTAPTSGSVMTADITAYRRVRLSRPFQWRQISPAWYFASPDLIEVVE